MIFQFRNIKRRWQKIGSSAFRRGDLKAAIYAGTDGVYFGLSDFNARKGAKTFL